MGLTETAKMGVPDYETQTPMGLDLTNELPPQTVGIKIYLSYYPFYA